MASIFHVIKRRPVTQLRLPPAACQGYLSSLRVLSAVSGRQIWALSVLVFQFLVHFTEDSRGAALIILAATSPGGFVFFPVVPILPALFHCCPPNTVTIGRHTPVTYAVLPAYYTVVLWCRLSAVTRQLPRPFCRHITPLYSGAGYRPSHASYLCRFAGILHRCTLVPVIGRHTPVTYAILPAYYTVVLWCRLSAVTRQLPMPFFRHITPLYSGAGYRPSHASYLGRFAGILHRCTLVPVIGRHTPVTYAVLPAYYTVVLWCRLSTVTRQLPMPFCRHVTPLYSGAGSPSVKSQLPVQFCRHITPLLPGAG